MVSLFAFFSVNASSALSEGYDYALKYDRFENKKIASYRLTVGEDCRITKTIKSILVGCAFSSVSNKPETPSIALVTTANEWDILPYSSMLPYSENKLFAILTYNDGEKKNMLLPVFFTGNRVSVVNRRSVITETIFVRLGSLKQDLLRIKDVELKYGSNEYYFKLDNALTRKSLNYQE